MKKFELIDMSANIKTLLDGLENLRVEGPHYITKDEIMELYILGAHLSYWMGRLDAEAYEEIE